MKHLVRKHHRCPSKRGNLNVRLAIPGERVLQRLDAEARLHGDGEPPGEDPARVPVDHRRQIDEAAGHRHVGDVHRPGLVGAVHGHSPQQVGIDLVTRCRFRRIRFPVQRLDPHPLHQRRDMPPSGRDPLPVQEIAQHPAPRKGELEMQLVDPPHDGEVRRRDGTRKIVDAAAADPERLCLFGDRETVMAIDHRFALRRPALRQAQDRRLPSAPDKKSLVNVSSPILAWSVFTSMATPPGLPSVPIQRLRRRHPRAAPSMP